MPRGHIDRPSTAAAFDCTSDISLTEGINIMFIIIHCLSCSSVQYRCICHDSVISCYSNMKMDYSACIFIILGHIDMPIFCHDTNFIRGHPVHLGEHLASLQSAISFDLCQHLILIT